MVWVWTEKCVNYGIIVLWLLIQLCVEYIKGDPKVLVLHIKISFSLFIRNPKTLKLGYIIAWNQANIILNFHICSPYL
jgi:hypothetical protein